jgi:biotin transport system substrate-specific component
LSLTLAVGRPTLADRIFSRHLATDLVLIAAGAALTSIAAQIAIPMWPVPITGQTFAVLLVGSVLGWARGALSMSLYLVLGVVGLPVFTDGASGSLLALSSGGYIVGFIVAAAFVGWLAQREWDHRILRTVLAFVGGSAIMYLFGLPWLFAWTGTLDAATLVKFFGTTDRFSITITAGLLPFLVGDALKAVAAGLILPATWHLVRRADAAKSADSGSAPQA